MPSSTEPATPEVHLEVETKLEVDTGQPLPDPLQHNAVRRAGLVSQTRPAVHQLDATYFDTDHLDLLRAKVTLRRRTGGDDAGWHLKLPADKADKAGGAGARTEVRMPLGRSIRIPDQLAQLVLGTARGRPLKPVARVQNQRTVIRLLDADGNAAVEIADDAVSATRSDSDRIDRWREIEVELIDGGTAQLEATVQALTDAGARPAGQASKLARVLPLPAITPAKGGSGKSAAAAVLTALARYRDKLIASERRLRQGADGAAHDVRADARRIRSVLRAFEGLFADEPTRALRDHLRELSRILGAARDVEMVTSRIAARLADEPEPRGRAAEELIHLELGRRSTTAMAELQRHLNSAEHLQLLRDLDSFLDDPPLTGRASKAAATELPVQLGRSWRRLRAKADAALGDPTDSPALHDVRRAAKTMRYAAESTIAVLGEQAVPFAAALQEVQEVLGEFRDAHITARLLSELADQESTDGASGFVFGRLNAAENSAAVGVIDDFADAWDRVEDADLATALAQD